MIKNLVAYILKLAIVAAPFFIVPWLLKEKVSYPWLAAHLGTTSSDAKDITVAVLTALDVTLLTVYEVFSRILPQSDARKLGEMYADSVLKAFEDEVTKLGLTMGGDVRINVMFARRLPVLLFLRRFVWFANRGFDGSHRDNGLTLLTLQGLCGRAFRERKALSVDLRKTTVKRRRPCRENFWLFPWQIDKTAHLTFILSIPVYWEFKEGSMTRHTVVGVVNIDAVSEAGAEGVANNIKRLDSFFKESGKLLAVVSSR